MGAMGIEFRKRICMSTVLVEPVEAVEGGA